MKLHTDVVNRLQMFLNKLQVIAALRYQRPLRSGLVCLCILVSMIFGATANAQSCYIWADTSGSQCTGQTAASVGACIVAYGMAEDRMYNDGASQRTYTGTACVDPPGPNSVGCYDQFNEYYPPNGTGGPYQELLLPDQVSGTQCPQYYIAATPVQRSETCSANCPADPINPGIGNVILTEEDVKFRGAGTIAYRRYYNSADQTGMDFVVGWRHSYDRSIQTIYQPLGTPYPGQSSLVSPGYPTPALACTLGFGTISGAVSSWASATAIFSGGVCTISSSSTAIATVPIEVYPTPTPPTSAIEYDVVRDDGQIFRFTLQGGSIVNPPGISLRLVTNGSGFTLTDDDDTVEVYNTAGVLQSITTRAGVAQTVTYDSNGLFYKVVDSFGNSLTVARNNASNIGSISLSGGGSVLYSPDSNYRLGSVTNLDGTTRSYGYQPSGTGSFFNELTSLVDESATSYSSWIYDSQERATSTHEAGGANLTSLIYNGDSSDSVTVKDALGAVRTFSYSRVGDINKVTGISGSQCPTCEESAATTYDSYGWVASRTDYNGNLTCYQNDPVRGLELYRVEGFASGSTCPATLSSYTPVSGTLQRKISTVWSTAWREPISITEPNRTTTFSNPDAHGNFQTKTITDTSVSPNVARIWRYTYTGYGQVLTVIGPRTDLVDKTTYTYWTCSTGYQCGQVETIQNSVGQVTTFNSYNAYGEPLTVTDPNGVVTTLTYDKRERLSTITVGTGASAEETQYSYWPTGLLETVTLPDLSTITYTYDGAHRLTTITDTLGNHIQYTLDAMGNPTETQSFDPSGTVHRTHYRTFTQLSELYTDVLAANTAAVTTTYTYDAQGNLTNIAAPLSRTTVNTPDALNRLSQIKDPASGITKIGYDANDNVASVVDPRTLTTTYTHNGFNQVTKLVSPDTGTSSTTYDSGGNVSTTTDARSALATYSYDALNRETKVVYSDQTINYTLIQALTGRGG